jgi:hypothetical protein
MFARQDEMNVNKTSRSRATTHLSRPMFDRVRCGTRVCARRERLPSMRCSCVPRLDLIERVARVRRRQQRTATVDLQRRRRINPKETRQRARASAATPDQREQPSDVVRQIEHVRDTRRTHARHELTNRHMLTRLRRVHHRRSMDACRLAMHDLSLSLRSALVLVVRAFASRRSRDDVHATNERRRCRSPDVHRVASLISQLITQVY